jgi:hypothetical protein
MFGIGWMEMIIAGALGLGCLVTVITVVVVLMVSGSKKDE